MARHTRHLTSAEIDAVYKASEYFTQPRIVEIACGEKAPAPGHESMARTLRSALSGNRIARTTADDLARAAEYLVDEIESDIESRAAYHAGRVAELLSELAAMRGQKPLSFAPAEARTPAPREHGVFGPVPSDDEIEPLRTSAASYPRANHGRGGGRQPERVADARRDPFERARTRFDEAEP